MRGCAFAPVSINSCAIWPGAVTTTQRPPTTRPSVRGPTGYNVTRSVTARFRPSRGLRDGTGPVRCSKARGFSRAARGIFPFVLLAPGAPCCCFVFPCCTPIFYDPQGPFNDFSLGTCPISSSSEVLATCAHLRPSGVVLRPQRGGGPTTVNPVTLLDGRLVGSLSVQLTVYRFAETYDRALWNTANPYL